MANQAESWLGTAWVAGRMPPEKANVREWACNSIKRPFWGKGQSADSKVFSFGQNCLTGNDGTQSWSSCAARNCTISRRCPALRLRRTLARVGNPREEPTASPTDSGLRFGYHRATRTVQGYAQRNQSGSSNLPGASANSRDYRVKGPHSDPICWIRQEPHLARRAQKLRRDCADISVSPRYQGFGFVYLE